MIFGGVEAPQYHKIKGYSTRLYFIFSLIMFFITLVVEFLLLIYVETLGNS
ncbi:hypothetical protein ACJX0J_021897, partial [Zea mays]